TITIAQDPAYPGQVRKYKAIKVTHLFKNIHIGPDSVIQFYALDGFSAPLSKQKLLNNSPKKAVAYLAIEPPSKKWPLLKSRTFSAGPFYLVWKNPINISSEEWPYRLSGFEIKSSLALSYPKIFPSPKTPKTHAIYKGFQVFVKNCFACHTLNRNGASKIGPDLNQPMNPTEYFKESALKKLIRNPEQVRQWPSRRMTGFPKSVISDKELEDLILYFKHMAKRKQ
ncbi:MAG: cytochrome c, partial [Bdellovibrio sp.]